MMAKEARKKNYHFKSSGFGPLEMIQTLHDFVRLASIFPMKSRTEPEEPSFSLKSKRKQNTQQFTMTSKFLSG